MGGQKTKNPRRRRALPAADPPGLQKALDPSSGAFPAYGLSRPSQRGGRGGRQSADVLSDVLTVDDDVSLTSSSPPDSQNRQNARSSREKIPEPCDGPPTESWHTFHQDAEQVAAHLFIFLNFHRPLSFVTKHGVASVNRVIGEMPLEPEGARNPAALFNWLVENPDQPYRPPSNGYRDPQRVRQPLRRAP